jgi:branched-chain amino acid transport system ATP-binding protein
MAEPAAAPDVPPVAEAMLKLDGVSAGYGRTTIIREIEMEVRPGQVVAVLGANGAGKSTLLRTIAGELTPSAGTIHYAGQNLAKVSSVKRALLGLSHVPEGRGIFRSLTVRENLTLFSRHSKDPSAVDDVLQAFPILGSRLGQRAGSLSGGEQQILAMAAAYCREVKLVLVDEPSLGLAPKIIEQVFDFLGELANRGTALIIVDQFADKVLKIANSAYILRRGSIVFSGPASTLGDDIFSYYLGSGVTHS